MKRRRNNTFSSAFEDVLEDGTRHYIGCPLFAVDPSDRSSGSGRIYANRYGAIHDFSPASLVEVPEFWRGLLRDDHPRREILSRSLAHYLQGGQYADPSFVNFDLEQAFAGWSHRIGEHTFQSNAYDLKSEEKSILALQKSVASSL
ncbi:hypothetical protein EXS74_02695 [Candidatus Woesearchaeota archaeon]|nr:hypothetical protein [Candidatus Woesearchaeota archaeon]